MTSRFRRGLALALGLLMLGVLFASCRQSFDQFRAARSEEAELALIKEALAGLTDGELDIDTPYQGRRDALADAYYLALLLACYNTGTELPELVSAETIPFNENGALADPGVPYALKVTDAAGNEFVVYLENTVALSGLWYVEQNGSKLYEGRNYY